MDELSIKRILDSPPAPVKEACKRLAVSYCNLLKSGRTFEFRGRSYHYFYHPYNLAWRNERSVEIPIATGYLQAHRGQTVLEVGNVLSHYMAVNHDILDKYEVAENVINQDAVDFAPDKKYDLIVSISTLEHIGVRGPEPDPEKARRVLSNLAGLLAPVGELVVTVPLGLNPALDELMKREPDVFDEIFALRRVRGNRWAEAEYESVRGAGYSRYRFKANALIVGIIREGPAKGTND